MKPYWKPQHETFIKGVLAHGDKTKAYLEAYPGTTPDAARTGACRIGNYPHIKERLGPVLQQRYEAAMEEAMIAAAERRAREENDIAEKRSFLAKLVNGKIKQRKLYKLNGKEIEMWQDPSHFLILRAIELDCKLEARYSRKQVLDRHFAKILSQLNLPSNSEHLVANSPANPTLATRHLKTETAGQSVKSAKSGVQTNGEQPVANSPANPTQATRHLKTETAGQSVKSGKSGVQTNGEHPVANSPAIPIQSAPPPNHKKLHLFKNIARRKTG